MHTEITLFDIPFRVVIWNIFRFVAVRISKSGGKLGRYQLFGYFKKDRFRKIFFLFPSLEVNQIEKGVLIDITRLHFACFPYRSWIASEIFSNSNETINLKEVILYDFDLNLFGVNIFSPLQSFPALKHVRFLTQVKNAKVSSKLIINQSILQNLESFSLYTGRKKLTYENNEFNLFKKVSFKNIKKLSLKILNFPVNGAILNLPKIEHLILAGCKNLKLIIGPNLKSINISKTETDSLLMKQIKNYVTSSQSKLTSFVIDGNFDSLNKIDWFFTSKCFKKMKKIEISFITFPKNIEMLFSTPYLTELLICNCVEINETMLDNELPKLRKLSLQNIKFRGNRFFRWMKNLQYLKITGLDILSNGFFSKNMFDSLRVLEMYEIGVKGIKNMPQFVNLEDLQVFHCSIDDSFLKDQIFRNLRRLILCDNDNITFDEKWKINRSNLKIVRLGRMKNFDIDSFMKAGEFEKLEFISVSDQVGSKKEMIGDGWGRMPVLKRMIIGGKCLKDCLFSQQEFNELVFLVLGKCFCIEGKGWKFLPKLKTLSLKKCHCNFEKLPFNEDVVIFET